jgi:hypothetical protein
MNHALDLLQRPLDLEQDGVAEQRAMALEETGRHDHVSNAVLVLQAEEEEAFGGRRPLADDDRAGDFDPGSMDLTRFG